MKIAENLESYHDVENLCLVDKALSVHIEDRFRRRKTAQVTTRVYDKKVYIAIWKIHLGMEVVTCLYS